MNNPVSVLVVEDEPLLRMDMVDTLMAEGYLTFEAADADEAIALLQANPSIQILFTDIDMPGSMDGLKLAAAVRDRWPPIRIVVTSGKRIVEITDLPSGSIFFSKPYRHSEILRSMQELMSD